MKQVFLNKSLTFVTKYNKFSEEDLIKLKYGLEGLYLTITKILIILALSFIFKIFKEVIILLFLFNFLRYFGFGFHAKKSSECLIFSIICFVIFPLAFLNIQISKLWFLSIGIICTIILFLFAPADTEKRPFPKTKKKLFRKIMTTFLSIVYLLIALLINNNTLSTLLFLAIIIESIFVNPLTYKVLNQPYNNYKSVD